MKQLFRSVAMSALIMLGLPWLAVTFAPGDAGMAICFLLFYGVNPVYACICGYTCAGKGKYMWLCPVLVSVLFLLGSWLFFDTGEKIFLIYALIYLGLGLVAMTISTFLLKNKTP